MLLKSSVNIAVFEVVVLGKSFWEGVKHVAFDGVSVQCIVLCAMNKLPQCWPVLCFSS